jgi:hypothetical protein
VRGRVRLSVVRVRVSGRVRVRVQLRAPRLADHSTSPEEGTEVGTEESPEEGTEEGTEVPEVVHEEVQEEVQEADKGEALREGEVWAGEVRAAAGAWAAAAEAPPSPRVASCQENDWGPGVVELTGDQGWW